MTAFERRDKVLLYWADDFAKSPSGTPPTLNPSPILRRCQCANAVERLVDARERGLTLREAAAAAGVHIATACRWAAGDPKLRSSLTLAGDRRFAIALQCAHRTSLFPYNHG